MRARYSRKAAFREYLEILGATAIAALFVRSFVFGAYRIQADAMSPALLQGDFVIVSYLSYGFSLPFSRGSRVGARPPGRGDVAILRSPFDERTPLAKRVIALAGDAVRIAKDGRVFVNDAPAAGLAAAYRAEGGEEIGPVIVPPGQVFVLSDNLTAAADPLPWGAVPERNLEGRVAWIWLSLDWENGRMSGARWPLIRWNRIGSAPSP